MAKPVLFVEPGAPKMRPVRLSDEVQELVTRSRINVSVDIVIIDRKAREFYLAVRVYKPRQGLWWIGGSMVAGQLEDQAAAKVFKRETGLDLEPHRFEFAEMHRALWKDRQEVPQDAGRDDLTYMMLIELGPDERESAARGLEREEYDRSAGLRGYDRAALLAADAHPLLLSTYDSVFPPA